MAPTSSTVAPIFKIIDDQNSSIPYAGAWVFAGGPDAEFNATHTSSVNVGDFFVVGFIGTAIGVYGTLQGTSAGVKTSYQIGNDPEIIVTTPSSGDDNYGQLFWQSDVLPSGVHTLTVTMVSVSPTLHTVFFDYFNVTSDATSTISGPASSSLSSVISTTSGLSSTASSSPSSSTTNGTRKSSRSGRIGGVIGALVVCIFIFIAFVLYRRRRRAQRSPEMSSAGNGPSSIEPFLQNQVRMNDSYNPPVSLGLGEQSTRSSMTPSSSIPSARQKGWQTGAFSAAGSSTVDSRVNSDSTADLKRRQQQVVNSNEQGTRTPVTPTQHVDSGVRLIDPTGPDASDIPPVYTPN
ncbi:hypothetical protein B0H19DRAFT_1379118 [Mycena capillaripes]|nr:hypothetical protein B0H19DRAFT_1379118 [Mycena capillaripes]